MSDSRTRRPGHHGLGNFNEPWRTPSSAPQGNDVRGFDTTGTRLARPNLSSPMVGAVTGGLASIPGIGPWLPLIQYAFKVVARQSSFSSTSFVASNVAAIQIRPQEDRGYFLVQNNSNADIYLGIGYAPSASTGLVLPAGAVYEPFQVPQNEMFIFGSNAGPQNGICLYANM